MSLNIHAGLFALCLAMPLTTVAASAQSTIGQSTTGQKAPPQPRAVPSASTPHRLAIQVNDNDPKLMNLALNNVANLTAYYKAKGEPIQIEVVTYGPGLHMLRADTSPVKARISAMSLEMPHVTFSACQNTRENMSKAENKPVDIVSEAKSVPSGVVTLLELQEKGFAYIRP
jgi:uncharacterized protein